jgi:hypothetical protein
MRVYGDDDCGRDSSSETGDDSGGSSIDGIIESASGGSSDPEDEVDGDVA